MTELRASAVWAVHWLRWSPPAAIWTTGGAPGHHRLAHSANPRRALQCIFVKGTASCSVRPALWRQRPKNVQGSSRPAAAGSGLARNMQNGMFRPTWDDSIADGGEPDGAANQSMHEPGSPGLKTGGPSRPSVLMDPMGSRCIAPEPPRHHSATTPAAAASPPLPRPAPPVIRAAAPAPIAFLPQASPRPSCLARA